MIKIAKLQITVVAIFKTDTLLKIIKVTKLKLAEVTELKLMVAEVTKLKAKVCGPRSVRCTFRGATTALRGASTALPVTLPLSSGSAARSDRTSP